MTDNRWFSSRLHCIQCFKLFSFDFFGNDIILVFKSIYKSEFYIYLYPLFENRISLGVFLNSQILGNCNTILNNLLAFLPIKRFSVSI